MHAPKYLTTEELGERLRTPAATIRYWHTLGKGPESVKIGRRRLYPLDAVEAFERALRGDAA